MNTKEFKWKAVDGISFYGKYWSPDNEIKGVVCLVHGMGEHCNRYNPLGDFLSKNQIALIGFDQRGHGQSEGKRGHTPSYEHLMLSIDDLLSKAQEFFPELPIILFGHSMGGNLVLNYGLTRKPQVNGIIASSPWLRLAFDPPAIQLFSAKLLHNIFPSLAPPTRLDVNSISRIAEEVKKYDEDPLVHDRMSLRFFISCYERGEWILEHASEWENMPLMVYHGTGDQLTSSEATKEFADKISGDITARFFEGAYHETHYDLVRDEVFEMLRDWLNAHF